MLSGPRHIVQRILRSLTSSEREEAEILVGEVTFGREDVPTQHQAISSPLHLAPNLAIAIISGRVSRTRWWPSTIQTCPPHAMKTHRHRSFSDLSE